MSIPREKCVLDCHPWTTSCLPVYYLSFTCYVPIYLSFLPKVYLRSTYGLPMVYLRSTYGLPMVYLWSTYGYTGGNGRLLNKFYCSLFCVVLTTHILDSRLYNLQFDNHLRSLFDLFRIVLSDYTKTDISYFILPVFIFTPFFFSPHLLVFYFLFSLVFFQL
jgi:hypothetical protein